MRIKEAKRTDSFLEVCLDSLNLILIHKVDVLLNYIVGGRRLT